MLNHASNSLEATAIVLTVIVVISVGCRFWSRLVNPGISLWLDDWLVLAAFFPTLATLAICIWGAHHELGKHATQILPQQNAAILKAYMTSIMTFDVALALGKLSALAFYVRIFGWRSNPSRVWKIAMSLGALFAVTYTLIDISVSITMCRPVPKFWNDAIPGHCVSQVVNFATMTCYSIFTDIYILILPMPLIFKLHMKRSKKLLIFATFFIGYCTPVMSVGRLVTAASVGNAIADDFSYAFVPIAYWCVAEPSILILAVSLHALFQLGKRGYMHGPGALFNKRDYTQVDSNRNGARDMRSVSTHRLNQSTASSDTRSTSSYWPRPLAEAFVVPQQHFPNFEDDSGMQEESIRVRREITVDYDAR